MSVGFIGLGNVGLKLANNLLSSEHLLFVHRHLAVHSGSVTHALEHDRRAFGGGADRECRQRGNR